MAKSLSLQSSDKSSPIVLGLKKGKNHLIWAYFFVLVHKLNVFLGSEVSSAECRRSDDGSPVNEEKCDAGQKPPRATVHCNYQPCPPM